MDLRGFTPSGVLRFALPTLELAASYHFDSGTETAPPVLDTVIIEPDAGRLMMVWRAALPCDKRVLKVREVEIALRNFPQRMAAA